MVKNIVQVDGMACGMCEAHIGDAIRAAFPNAKKVKVSRRKKQAVFLSEEAVDEETVRNVIDKTGYHFMGFSTEEK